MEGYGVVPGTAPWRPEERPVQGGPLTTEADPQAASAGEVPTPRYPDRGVPKVLFCDNGSEFTSQAMDLWAYRNGATIDFSRPGKPTDNAFVESFNGTLRSECLNTHWFRDLPAT